MTIISCRAKYFIAAPNLLRIGVEETVSIDVYGIGGEVDIQLSLQDFPNKRKTFSQVSGKFRAGICFFLRMKFVLDLLSLSHHLLIYLSLNRTTWTFENKGRPKLTSLYHQTLLGTRGEREGGGGEGRGEGVGVASPKILETELIDLSRINKVSLF